LHAGTVRPAGAADRRRHRGPARDAFRRRAGGLGCHAGVRGHRMNTIALPYRELAIGASYEGTARTLTQTDLSLACMLSGDWHPIHADAEFCRAAGMPGPMFHGPYGILLAMGMATSLPAFADRVV